MSQQQQYRVPLVVLLLLLLVVMVTAKQQHYKPSTPPKNVYQYTPQSCSNSNMNYCAPGIHGAGGCYNPGYKYCQQGVMCDVNMFVCGAHCYLPMNHQCENNNLIRFVNGVRVPVQITLHSDSEVLSGNNSKE